MRHTDAAQILGLSGEITPADVKRAYRQAAMTYHPDRNPAGAEMMKVINAAYDALKDYSGEIDPETAAEDGTSYPEALNEALNAIIALDGLEIEVCGAWVWVAGNTRSHRQALKAAGFFYASKKQRWYFRPENWRSASRGKFSMDDIRDKYGSTRPHFKQRSMLEAGRAGS